MNSQVKETSRVRHFLIIFYLRLRPVDLVERCLCVLRILPVGPHVVLEVGQDVHGLGPGDHALHDHDAAFVNLGKQIFVGTVKWLKCRVHFTYIVPLYLTGLPCSIEIPK